jgi:hypothetical protein
MRQEIRGNEGNPDERVCFESDSQGKAGGTPFNCPKCKHQMSVKDPDFNEHVESIIMID